MHVPHQSLSDNAANKITDLLLDECQAFIGQSNILLHAKKTV